MYFIIKASHVVILSKIHYVLKCKRHKLHAECNFYNLKSDGFNIAINIPLDLYVNAFPEAAFLYLTRNVSDNMLQVECQKRYVLSAKRPPRPSK